MKKLVIFPRTFVLMNWAAVVGLYCFLRGEKNVWLAYGNRSLGSHGWPRHT